MSYNLQTINGRTTPKLNNGCKKMMFVLASVCNLTAADNSEEHDITLRGVYVALSTDS